VGAGGDGRAPDLRGHRRSDDRDEVRRVTPAGTCCVTVIGLVTDSSSQLPPTLRDRFHVHVVPLTIVVDGQEFDEGVDLTAGDFYARLAAGAEVSTAAPSPGRILDTWNAAMAAGATEILSIHIGSNTSATVNSANLAVAMCEIPVTVIDTGTASFPVACCVWGAGLALERGATLEEAATVTSAVAAAVDNVFIVGALDLARRGGRLAPGAEQGEGLPVLALHGGTMQVVDRVHDREAAVDAMARYVADRSAGRVQRAGVGHAGAPDLADELAGLLDTVPDVAEIVRYEVGPSVGAHTGLGTAGCVFFPEDLT
jgi:DegV family protein with EDD domain